MPLFGFTPTGTPADTLNDFDAAVQWLLTTEHDYQPLEEAILGVISAIDNPAHLPVKPNKPSMPNSSTARVISANASVIVYYKSPEDLKARTYLIANKASIAVVTNAETSKQIDQLRWRRSICKPRLHKRNQPVANY